MERVEEPNLHLHRVVNNYNQKAAQLQVMRQMARERIFNIHHMLLIDDPFEQDEYAMEIDDYGSTFTSAREALLKLPLNEHEQRLLNVQGKLVRQAVPLQRDAVVAIQSDRPTEAKRILLNEVIPIQHKVLATLTHLEAMQAKAIEQTFNQAEQQHSAARKDLALMGGGVLLLGLCIFLFTVSITRRLSHQAHHDPLTGSVNRRGFESYLARLLQQPDEPADCHLCMMDLDHFKRVNDECGHAAGDELLQVVTKTIADEIRQGDFLARLGGDEFALVLQDCPLTQVRRITENIGRNIARLNFHCDGRSFQIGISIGITAINTKYTAHELSVMADAACYSAKEQGRNLVRINHGNPHRSHIVGFELAGTTPNIQD